MSLAVLGICLWSFTQICGILTHVFLCLWVYRDAKNRCVDAALWTVITLFLSVIGLILYYAVGRKNPKTKCPRCFAGVNPDAKYCQNCGNELSPDTIVGYNLFAAFRQKRNVKPMIIGFVVSLVLCILLAVAQVVLVMHTGISYAEFSSEKKDSIPFEYFEKYDKGDHLQMEEDKKIENTWEISLDAKDQEVKETKTITIQNGKPDKLYVDYGIDSGTVMIAITQNEKTSRYQISGNGSAETIDLSSFGEGNIVIDVSTENAEDADIEMAWEK